jgi:hypothetical protein
MKLNRQSAIVLGPGRQKRCEAVLAQRRGPQRPLPFFPQQPLQMSGITVSTLLSVALRRGLLGTGKRLSGDETEDAGRSRDELADRVSPSFACEILVVARKVRAVAKSRILRVFIVLVPAAVSPPAHNGQVTSQQQGGHARCIAW